MQIKLLSEVWLLLQASKDGKVSTFLKDGGILWFVYHEYPPSQPPQKVKTEKQQ